MSRDYGLFDTSFFILDRYSPPSPRLGLQLHLLKLAQLICLVFSGKCVVLDIITVVL